MAMTSQQNRTGAPLDNKKKGIIEAVRRGTFLQRAVLALLFGAFVMLLLEVRFAHKIVIVEKWYAWIPIVYFAIMLVVIPVGMLTIRKPFGRILLATTFGAAVFIGIAGSLLHTKGHPIEHVINMIKTDLSAPGRLSAEGDPPPPLAPLSLVGLGLIGVLVSLWEPNYRPRDQSKEESDPTS